MDVSRRTLFHLTAGAGAAVLLTACGTSPATTAGQAPDGPPRRGGVLRVGALGKGSAITRDPHGVQNNESDYLIISLVHDTLTAPGESSNVVPRLASKWEPNADLTKWRLQIAENAKFHDGTPVTSEDVVWSLRRLRATPSGASRLPGIEADGIQADGPNAVVLTSGYPNSELPVLLRLTTFILKKDTTDVATAPGAGPFKLESYRDGNAKLVRNEHWRGEVLLDGIEVVMFESPQAMANAALTGQIDLASNVGAVAARTAAGRPEIEVVRRPNDMAMPIVLRTADGPFADPRVREAIRLGVDRDAMVKQALSGYGVPANDILGTGDPAYAKDIPQRKRDIERARKLLGEAGFDTARAYQLLTTEDIPGLAESATLFATQVRDIGVQVEVVKQESKVFWDATWLKAPMYTTYWGTNDSVVFFAAKTMNSQAAQNEAGWQDPGFDAAYKKAVNTAEPAARTAALQELQQIEYERSGYVLWGMADGVDLAAKKVRGLPKLGGYGRVQLERTWLAS